MRVKKINSIYIGVYEVLFGLFLDQNCKSTVNYGSFKLKTKLDHNINKLNWNEIEQQINLNWLVFNGLSLYINL